MRQNQWLHFISTLHLRPPSLFCNFYYKHWFKGSGKGGWGGGGRGWRWETYFFFQIFNTQSVTQGWHLLVLYCLLLQILWFHYVFVGVVLFYSAFSSGAFRSTQNSGNFGWYIKCNGPFRFGPTGIFGTSFEGGPLWPVWSFRSVGPKCPSLRSKRFLARFV